MAAFAQGQLTPLQMQQLQQQIGAQQLNQGQQQQQQRLNQFPQGLQTSQALALQRLAAAQAMQNQNAHQLMQQNSQSPSITHQALSSTHSPSPSLQNAVQPNQQKGKAAVNQNAQQDSKANQMPQMPQQQAASNFMKNLFEFMHRKGTPIKSIPTIGEKPVNVYILYQAVMKLGGSQQVTKSNAWPLVAQGLGLLDVPNSPALLAQVWQNCLASFEEVWMKAMASQQQAQQLKQQQLLQQQQSQSPNQQQSPNSQQAVLQQQALLRQQIAMQQQQRMQSQQAAQAQAQAQAQTTQSPAGSPPAASPTMSAASPPATKQVTPKKETAPRKRVRAPKKTDPAKASPKPPTAALPGAGSPPAPGLAQIPSNVQMNSTKSPHPSPYSVSKSLPSPKPAAAPSPANAPSPAVFTPKAKESSPIATRTPPGEPPRKPAKVEYVPKKRIVETYGGLDMKLADRLPSQIMLPHVAELGSVDVHALILSLRSRLTMEVNNALNVLTIVTAVPETVIPLQGCPDLLDELLDLLEIDLLTEDAEVVDESEHINGKRKRSNDSRAPSPKRTRGQFLNYSKLFARTVDDARMVRPPVAAVVHSTTWLSPYDRSLAILNLIRNFSFMTDNHMFLAMHPRLVSILGRLFQIGIDDAESVERGVTVDYAVPTSMDMLNLQKDILMIFANIGACIRLSHLSTAKTLLGVCNDFVTADAPPYTDFAVELLAKLTLVDDNRSVASHVGDALIQSLFDATIEMLPADSMDMVVSVIGSGPAQNPQAETAMARLEFLCMAIYNLVFMAQDKASSGDVELIRWMFTKPGLPRRLLRLGTYHPHPTHLPSQQPLDPMRTNMFYIPARRCMEILRMLAKGNKNTDAEGSLNLLTDEITSTMFRCAGEEYLMRDLSGLLEFTA